MILSAAFPPPETSRVTFLSALQEGVAAAARTWNAFLLLTELLFFSVMGVYDGRNAEARAELCQTDKDWRAEGVGVARSSSALAAGVKVPTRLCAEDIVDFVLPLKLCFPFLFFDPDRNVMARSASFTSTLRAVASAPSSHGKANFRVGSKQYPSSTQAESP